MGIKQKTDSIWCSEAFRARIFTGGGQHDQKFPNPVDHFYALIRKYLPGYIQLLPSEYHFTQLLGISKNCIDIAFLTAVWRYAERMSPTCFPCRIIRNFISPSTGKPLLIVEDRLVKKRKRAD